VCRAEIARGEQKNQGNECENEKPSKHVTKFHLARKRKRRLRSMRAKVGRNHRKERRRDENHKNQTYTIVRRIDSGFQKSHLPIFTSHGSLPIKRRSRM
jgi:hypothetical protein